MTLDKICFEKKNQNYYMFLLFSPFVWFLPRLTNKWSHTTLLMFEEGAIKYVLRAKTWLDGFDSVFLKITVEFLFVVCFVVLFGRLKKIIGVGPNPLL